jgi:proteasome lid subunit RPN8/RPN11
MPYLPLTDGRTVFQAALKRCSDQIGKTAPHSTYHVTGRASLDTLIGAQRCRQKSGDRLTEFFNTWSLCMNFFKAAIMQCLFAPRCELRCSLWIWWRLMSGLRQRGCGCSRESGAFLLGRRQNGMAQIVDFVLYDDLDPNCLSTGIVRFDGRYFGRLWEICKQRSLIVIADVHTHPGASDQSHSDRNHPMISRVGHIALIVPRFAVIPVRRSEIGMYRYQGAKLWTVVPSKDRCNFLRIGL